MLKAIIIDDELKSRENLRILVEDFCDGISILGTCKNVKEGLEYIKKYTPDIVFLDIQMQKETGFDLLNQVGEINFNVIFTTAHSEYALKAFKYSALDYLLKPIDVDDLVKAVKKATNKKNSDTSGRVETFFKNLNTGSGENLKIALPHAEGFVFVKVRDILYCEADSNYTRFYLLDGRKILVSKTLKEYETLLSDQNFFRIHNSHLINLGEILKYVKGDGGYVVLNNNVTLEVAKRKKSAFLEKIAFIN
jgi:two-component system LytT family response regulator